MARSLAPDPTATSVAVGFVPTPIALPLFFLSGACALVYQTVWVRQLTLSFGISIYAVSAVIAAFMFGLCAGAYWIGRLSDRIRNPLRVYGYCELAIALYAVFLHFALADLLPVLLRLGVDWLPSGSASIHVVRFTIAFCLLLLPTILMGGTLPLLARTRTDSPARTGPQLGLLYGINTLGAMAGTGLAGLWMLKDFGLFGTTLIAVVVNVGIALLALIVARRSAPLAPATPAPAVARTATSAVTRPRAVPSGIIEFVIFLSGFSALSYEIIWNRTLLLYVHNSTYAFSIILMVFLFGVSAGSLVYSRLPARFTSMRVLGLLQILLAVYVWASIEMTGRLPLLMASVADVLGTDTWGAALSAMGAATIAIVFVPTFIMGMTFPMATAMCADDTHAVGSRIGNSYGFVTFGNILGSLITGFVLIEAIGLRNSLAVSIALNFLGGFLLLLHRPRSWARVATSVACASAAVVVMLSTVDREIFRRFYEAKYPKILFYKEEVTDNVMVVEGDTGRAIRYSDGRGTAGTGTDPANRIYGHLPALLHPDPRSILSICFGVGNTLSALAQYEPDRFVCVELSPGAIEAAPYFWTNLDVLHTPNLEVHIEDGRNFLLMSDERFDVIELEPPEIHSATVVNLYTREFYEMALEDLTERGVLCQWINVAILPEHELKMMIRAFTDVFPHGSAWSGGGWADILLVGSPVPIQFTAEEIQQRFDRPKIRADLERFGIDSPIELLGLHLLAPADLQSYVADVSPVTDDRTYVDFSVPQQRESGFGVFLYHNLQLAPVANIRNRIIEHEQFMLRRTSPAYMVDANNSDSARHRAFLEALERDVDARRLGGRERLAAMGAPVED